MRKIDLQKAKSQVARSNTIRNINKRIVLNYVREREPISRAEIAKQTALQRSTVSSIVNSLIEEGFIKETGAGESSGGRKPTMLELRRDAAVAVGVDITPSVTTIAAANLAGEILAKDVFETSPDRAETFERIVQCVKKIKSKLRRDNAQIGISVPGVVDETSGIVTYIPFFGWKDWTVKEDLARAVGLPVLIENDANAIALAESWFGKPEVRGVKSFITVLVAEGIGTGIFFDGQIYRGHKGAAGEFGHMIVGGGTKSETACSCGGRQCLEAFTSNKATIARFNKATKKNEKDFDVILELAQRGDARARQTISETARHLAFGIVNLIVGLSPEAVIISGKITKLWSLIEKDLIETVNDSIKQKIPSARITISTLGESPTLMGAVSLSLINKFASAS
jgi:predicted NBD/HSP70 family sugar kinase